MSLDFEKLPVAKVYDPTVDVNSKHYYVIRQGGENVRFYPVSTTSFSSSNISWAVIPPSLNTFTDRKVMMRIPVELTFTGTEDLNLELLQLGQNDAFRAFPINCALIQSLNININNTNVSINSNEIMQALLRYGIGRDLLNFDYSMTPNYLDTLQNYEEWTDAINGACANPLGGYLMSDHVSGRGSFPYESLDRLSPGVWRLRAMLTEFIYLSPFTADHCSATGFIGLSQMNVQLNIDPLAIGPLSTLWSHSTLGNSITSITATIGYGSEQPKLLFRTVTPPSIMPMPRVLVYDYYEISRYVTDYGTITAGSSQSNVLANNIQINSVPRAIYLYARRKNSDRSAIYTDTFFRIDKVMLSYKNRDNLLSSGTPQDIYKMSVENGLKMSYQEYYDNVGSVVCIFPSRNIGLAADSAEGQIDNIQLQVQLDITNLNQTEDIPMAIYIVVVAEGTFTIEKAGSSAHSNVGILTAQDILNSDRLPLIDYQTANTLYNGGSFMGNVKSASKQIANFAKKYGPDVINAVKKYGPDVAKTAAKVAPALLAALGEGEGMRKKRGRLADRY